jgi:hypothetical protein
MNQNLGMSADLPLCGSASAEPTWARLRRPQTTCIVEDNSKGHRLLIAAAGSP